MMDFAVARQKMVDGQVRPNKVSDPRILAAMRELPRENFLPADRRAIAYIDQDIRLPGGRVMMEPMVLARLVQAAAVRPGERALVVAAGTGYSAALLARCGATVTALESDPALTAIARAALAGTAPEVTIAEGPAPDGWPAGGPYTLVLIDGAVSAIPDPIAAQVAEGGRIVTVLAGDTGIGTAVLAPVFGGRAVARPLFDAGTPLLAGFAPAPAFVF